jgi:hypothetical protein
MNKLEKYGQDLGDNPVKTTIKIGLWVLVVVTVLGVAASMLGVFGETAQVAREEFGPRAALQKYEWFKDAVSTLDEKKATLAAFEQREKEHLAAYEGVPRVDWPRDARQQFSQWRTERSGIAAIYNSLAAEFNAAHAKINWRFADVGNLPKGQAEALPRDFRQYIID